MVLAHVLKNVLSQSSRERERAANHAKSALREVWTRTVKRFFHPFFTLAQVNKRKLENWVRQSSLTELWNVAVYLQVCAKSSRRKKHSVSGNSCLLKIPNTKSVVAVTTICGIFSHCSHNLISDFVKFSVIFRLLAQCYMPLGSQTGNTTQLENGYIWRNFY